MKQVFISWISGIDLDAMEGRADGGQIATALAAGQYETVSLLSTDETPEQREKLNRYPDWLRARFPETEIIHSPGDFSFSDAKSIYELSRSALNEFANQEGNAQITLNLSSGTRAMSAIWMLLAKSGLYQPEPLLLESNNRTGVNYIELPFDIASEFLPERNRRINQRAAAAASRIDPFRVEERSFEDIQLLMPSLSKQVRDARKVAASSLEVLITGESGTGKEVFAKAIHAASGRKGRFVPINCGALPEQLAESELFGHVKGAFTGADRDKIGAIEYAEGGTLFLDEIGELALHMQAKLLRVLQEKRVRRVGAVEERAVDFRLLSATNRSLREMMRQGTFREDLNYRIDKFLIQLPPLRERRADFLGITNHFLQEISQREKLKPPRKLSPAAYNRLRAYSWPGNLRELDNVLSRLAVWCEETIEGADVAEVLPKDGGLNSHDLMNQPLGDGFKLEALLKKIESGYIERAMEEAGGKKTLAAKMLGLSHQTLANWTKKTKSK